MCVCNLFGIFKVKLYFIHIASANTQTGARAHSSQSEPTTIATINVTPIDLHLLLKRSYSVVVLQPSFDRKISFKFANVVVAEPFEILLTNAHILDIYLDVRAILSTFYRT